MNHDTTLIDQIAQLSPDQAQEAIYLFYQLLPANWWTDQEKMSQDDIDFQARKILQHATDDVKPFLQALVSPDNLELKGDIARELLRGFAAHEPLHPYLKQAVEMAYEPDMFVIETGTLLIILALLPTVLDIKKTKDGWEVHIHFENLKALSGLSDIAQSIKQILGKNRPPSERSE
jgi:hypothetical protein